MSAQPFLSVLLPAYNERRTIERVVATVLQVDEPLELVIVDDGSTDGTWDVIEAIDDSRVRRVQHPKNRGKGAAIRTALQEARGEYVIIQDADLEYDPNEYPALLAPVRAGRARVVYGTRTFTSHAAFSFWYVIGNRVVTLAANLLYNVYLSDLETAYKLMPLEVARRLNLRSNGFEIEPEITAKLIRMGERIYEVPVSYLARSRAEGKKLTAMDGVRALVTLARYRGWTPR